MALSFPRNGTLRGGSTRSPGLAAAVDAGAAFRLPGAELRSDRREPRLGEASSGGHQVMSSELARHTHRRAVRDAVSAPGTVRTYRHRRFVSPASRPAGVHPGYVQLLVGVDALRAPELLLGQFLSAARFLFPLGQDVLGFLSPARVFLGSGSLTFEHLAGALGLRELRLGALLVPLSFGAARPRLNASLTGALSLALAKHQQKPEEQQHHEHDDESDDPCIHGSVIPGSFVDGAPG